MLRLRYEGAAIALRLRLPTQVLSPWIVRPGGKMKLNGIYEKANAGWHSDLKNMR